MKVVTRTLGDICDEVGGIIQTGPFGSQLHQSDYQDDGVPVVMPQNIVDGRVSVNGIARIAEEDATRLSRHRLKAGDIVYGRRGDIGRRALITAKEEGWLCGTGSLRISLGNLILDETFLYYYLGQSGVIAWIYNQAVGATLPNLNTKILKSVPVAYPSLPVQCKIASILSAYDDLIESNIRRIKILEEMAQLIYREWFVEFRFPGHEKVKMVKSELGPIPEGWEVSRLGQHLEALESGKRPRGGVREFQEGIPSVGAENIRGIGIHDYQSEKFVPQEFFEALKKGRVLQGDVALYKDGAYIGRSSYFRNGFPHIRFCVNEHVFLLRTSGNRLTQNLLYLWLQESSTIDAIRSTNSNAAQPGINQNGVQGLRVLVAKPSIVERFDGMVEPYFALIMNLARKCTILRTTRDLLLPKLISGEVDVSDLDIAVAKEA